MLKGKKILFGITGSIAAYKSILLVRLLIKAGAEVKVILTPAAEAFVSQLVLATLSKNKVLINLFEENTWSNHVILGRWADVMLIAPLSCNTLSKMASGQCDNLLLAVYLSATCPVIVAPAMDEDMWHHPSVKKNIQTIISYSNHVINVETGDLASGLSGEGRMAEPEMILNTITETFFRGTELSGKKVLITAGPTYEAIDPVRFISNHSSGKMGFALAKAFYLKGADVELITGPVEEKIFFKGLKITHVKSADEMYNACINSFKNANIAVMNAAVADFTPAEVANEKIKKADNDLTLQLVKTKDILKALGSIKKEDQFLAGFALETSNERENSMQKLKSKNADMIVLNSLKDERTGFGYDTNKVTIFEKTGNEYSFQLDSKEIIAEKIVNSVIKYIHV